jgi:uncharacterized protein (TIGR03083 family)
MSRTMTPNHEDTRARRSRLDRRTAMRLAADEYTRFAEALAGLDDADWSRPTACTKWDVRQVACHTVGMAEMIGGIREGNRQRAIAKDDAGRKGIPFIDALTDVQVRERDDWEPARVVREMPEAGRRAARGRRRTPFFMRRRTMPVPQLVNGHHEHWTIGYMVDTILTRDPWMHRIDLSVATGHELVLTPEHDGAIVADVVAEWAERHGRSYSLTLTGPAGGSWTSGVDGPTIEMGATEFCRVVSGRGTGEGLLETQVPF